jgi:hypothetical protein
MTTFSSASNQAACAARTGRLNGGLIEIWTTAFGTKLVTLTLGSPAYGTPTTASPSVATANAITPGIAVATGTAAAFRLYQSNGSTLEASGSVSGPSGGGDIELLNTSIASGQSVGLSALPLSQP